MYPASQIHGFSANYENAGGSSNLASYYAEAYDRIAMKEALRRNILFFQHDPVADHVFGEMHVIFCRNVFICFGETLRTRMLERFAHGLCPGGFLCLGTSERLLRSDRDTFKDFAPDDRIYCYTAMQG